MSIIKKIVHFSFAWGFNVLVNILFFPYVAWALEHNEYAAYGQTLLAALNFTGI